MEAISIEYPGKYISQSYSTIAISESANSQSPNQHLPFQSSFEVTQQIQTPTWIVNSSQTRPLGIS
jgi:hypothetical protein